METNAKHRISGRPMFAPLAKAIVLVLGLLALGYFAVLADTNTQPLQGGFAGHAAASQMPSAAPAKWDVDPYVDPAAKVAEPIATF